LELPQFLSEWNIIPAVRNQKNPIGKWTKYQELRCPREELDNYNNANYLAVCGKTSDNLFAIDLDFKKTLTSEQVQEYFYKICEKLQEALPDISNTRVHQTPHGFHLIFSAEEPVSTKHFTNIFRKKGKRIIFTGVVKTNFDKCLNGIDFQGEGALIMIPPSEVNQKQYRVINGNAGVRKLNKAEVRKLIDFFVLKKPKKMRSKFVDIINGKLEIEYLAASRTLPEHVYWRYMYIEAWARIGLTPHELYPFLELNQPAFSKEKTEGQFNAGVEWETDKAMTSVKYKEYFFKADPDDDFTEAVKKTEKKAESGLDFSKMTVKELTDYVANMSMDEFPIKTLDDSRQIMIKENNHYSFQTNGFYQFIKEMIDLFRRGSYTSFKRNIEEMIKDSTLIKRDSFCTASHIINFKNGVYNVVTEEFFEEYEGDFFYCIPHSWDKGEFECPKFEQALKDWLIPKDKSNIITNQDIYEMIGLCMSTHTGFKKSFINIGDKDSGKTQFLNIVAHVVGTDNTTAIPLQRMTKDQFGTVGLQMKLLNAAGEIGSGIVKNPETFKILTGDDFKVGGEIKGGARFDFTNFATFWFNANNFPTVIEIEDLAFFDRFLIIMFPNVFKKTDKGFKLKFFETITTKEEIQGIMYNAMQGLQRLIKRKGFREEIQENTRHQWLYQSDKLYRFLHDYCEIVKGDKVKKEKLYDVFSDLSDTFLSKNKFTVKLQRYGVVVRQMRAEYDSSIRNYYYCNIKLKDGVGENYKDEDFEVKKLNVNSVLEV